MLLRIGFVSQASAPSLLELKDILARSRQHNRQLGTTGAMGFIDGLYLQCLEGEASVVNTLFRRIEQDSRHLALKALVNKPVSERAFPGWSSRRRRGDSRFAGAKLDCQRQLDGLRTRKSIFTNSACSALKVL